MKNALVATGLSQARVLRTCQYGRIHRLSQIGLGHIGQTKIYGEPYKQQQYDEREREEDKNLSALSTPEFSPSGHCAFPSPSGCLMDESAGRSIEFFGLHSTRFSASPPRTHVLA
jgi:hypothetical protein